MKNIREMIATWAVVIVLASLVVLTISSLCYTAECSAYFQMGSIIVGSVAFFVYLMAIGPVSNERYLEYLDHREKMRQKREKMRQKCKRRR